MECWAKIKCRGKESNSNEHIIPKIIRGTLTSKILCKECNGFLGEKTDYHLELIKNVINLFVEDVIIEDANRLKYNISQKDIQVVNTQKIKGTENDFYTSIIVPKSFDLSKYSVTEEKKKFRGGKIATERYITEIGLTLALYKIAINFAVYKLKSETNLKNIIDLFKKNLESNNIDELKPFISICKEKIENVYDNFHELLLIGNKEEKELIVFINLYNTIIVKIILNNNYICKEITEHYFKELKNQVKFFEEKNIVERKEFYMKKVYVPYELSKFSENVNERIKFNKYIYDISKKKILPLEENVEFYEEVANKYLEIYEKDFIKPQMKEIRRIVKKGFKNKISEKKLNEEVIKLKNKILKEVKLKLIANCIFFEASEEREFYISIYKIFVNKSNIYIKN